MKKLFLIAMLFVAGVAQLKANDTIINVTQLNHYQGIDICLNKFERALVYTPASCTEYYFYVNGELHSENPVILDSNENTIFHGEFVGCGISSWIEFFVAFLEPNIPNSTSTSLWKHQGYPVALESIGADSLEMYDFHWNTGETTPTIEVTATGTYTCDISDLCATATRTFIVKDNVEIALATCDLETNLNLVTWPTTPAQAEYVSEVEVKRDGLVVGTAPYADGHFLDNIGSGSASRTYTVTAIATDGTPCPIVSYPKETIHMAYLTGINNTIEVNWNVPTGYDLLGYNICEWNPDGDLSVIDYVGATVTSYTCQESQFDNGYIVVQGVEAGKDGETRLLSNRSYDLVGLGEQHTQAFKVYPNPTSGVFTVEGTGTLTVMNTLGQTVLTREITGKESVELPRGMWFVKLDETTRKIVVD